MSLPVFPVLPGEGWSVKKTPMFSTRVASHVSGREVRAVNYAHGLYQFELTFSGLASDGNSPGLFAHSLQMLLDLYVTSRGQFGVFVYKDPSDCIVRNGAIGTGDGTTALFQASRTLITGSEPVSIVTYLNQVYVNGAGAAGWYLVAPSQIYVTPAPPAGASVTADFEFGYRCRFLDDSQEFENWASGLWSVKSLKFRQIR